MLEDEFVIIDQTSRAASYPSISRANKLSIAANRPVALGLARCTPASNRDAVAAAVHAAAGSYASKSALNVDSKGSV